MSTVTGSPVFLDADSFGLRTWTARGLAPTQEAGFGRIHATLRDFPRPPSGWKRHQLGWDVKPQGGAWAWSVAAEDREVLRAVEG